jgi:hypothetical protein
LEYFPGFVKNIYLFSMNRHFKKTIRTKKLFKTDGKKRKEIIIEVGDDFRREKISEYMNSLYSFISPLELIKVPNYHF